MTQPELILKLVEQLIAEKEKNIRLQLQLEEYKKGKDQMCHYIVEWGNLLQSFLIFFIKKVDVVTDTSTANNIHNLS